jgi:hypothetical protein
LSPDTNRSHLQPVQNQRAAIKHFRLTDEKSDTSDVREFPIASTVPSLPPVMNDEVLDLYAFLFCQGGFRQLGMTFEQFLLVIATFKPGDLTATIRDTVASREPIAS